MIRTQILLSEETYEALRKRAFTERKSLSALVREIVDQALGVRRARGRKSYRLGFIGIVRGKKADVSDRHDEYLAGGPRW